MAFGIKKYFFSLPISEKFQTDVLWNVGSLFILGISGIAMNILIGRFYNADVLGIFNQVYAVYILSSQLAAGSVHISIQKYLSQYLHDKKKHGQIISSGLVIIFILGIIVAAIVYLTRNYLGLFLKSPEVSLGLIYIIPGLIFFALNKGLMAILNGLRLMKIFAITQALRYILMVLFLGLAIILHFDGTKLSFIFSGTEICLFLILSVISFKLFHFVLPNAWGSWTRRHIIFGYKSLLGSILVDVNTRVDVLILGYFASDRVVGIYSFAAILAEGFIQLLVVLRLNINPILARLFATKKIAILKETIKRGVKLTYLWTTVLGGLAIIIYPFMINLLVPGKDFLSSWPIFIILMLGIIASSGYTPFQMLLAQAGFPGYYTNLILIIFTSNVVFNILLVPSLGMYGSALGTGISFLISVLGLKFLTKKALRINI